MEYETCEVVYDSKGSLWWARYYFLARVEGPNGSYIAGTSAQFDNAPVDKFGQRNHAAESPLDALMHQLSQAGWEPVSSGPDWFSYRLRRAASQPSADGKTGFTVVLEDCGPHKIYVIKVVRKATGLGLKEAKDLVERAPTPVCSNVARLDAERVAQQLTNSGARVEIR